MLDKLWTHSSPQSTSIWKFQSLIEKKYDVRFEGYEALRQWSIKNLSDFWGEVWEYTGVKASAPYSKVIEDENIMFPRPAFFQGARLNFAENLLYPRCDPPELSVAVTEVTEEGSRDVSWKELREKVRLCTLALRKLGVVEGDRVAGYLANHCNCLVAMLSATSIGALWTGVSPDTGVHAVLDRLQQIEPKVLFSDNAVMYNGKIHEVKDKLKDITQGLPRLVALVIFETVQSRRFDTRDIQHPKAQVWKYRNLLDSIDQGQPHEFAQLPADHPVYILYSSGTTGKPKCIIHGAIGTLIQHKKEHAIHCDLRPGDKLFYFTTCTWMMWHWLVSALATGVTLVLYDGSPFRPASSSDPQGHLAMPRLINDLSVTHFGTSAKYLSLLEQSHVYPKTHAHEPFPMKSLRAIYSTGSPLAPSTFHYTYAAFGPDLNLASITGGTDIISLFGAPVQTLPVYAGEIQARGLGMAVEAFSPTGTPITDGSPGDLVCTRPFPCQPVAFFGAEGLAKYRSSYFEAFPGVWHHGDFVSINPATGGLVMLGRSDGVLKPAGVRFGSAEIYNVVLKHFAAEVEDALCVGRRRAKDSDEAVVLFLKMARGREGGFGVELVERIKAVVRRELSARHVPAMVDACPEIPVTTNGKKVEVAVKMILSGRETKTGASVANAECLGWYRRWAEEHQ